MNQDGRTLDSAAVYLVRMSLLHRMNDGFPFSPHPHFPCAFGMKASSAGQPNGVQTYANLGMGRGCRNDRRDDPA